MHIAKNVILHTLFSSILFLEILFCFSIFFSFFNFFFLYNLFVKIRNKQKSRSNALIKTKRGLVKQTKLNIFIFIVIE